MIDQEVFLQEIGILMDWYSRDFEPETLKRLHQRLSAHLTTEQFVQAAMTVFDKSRFFPTVDEFVSAVKGDAETNALHEWELCVKAAARGDRAMLAELSPQGQSALHLVGGLYKLGMATQEQLTWIKKEFVSVWKSTPEEDVKSLPFNRASDLEQMDTVRALSQKMGFNGLRQMKYHLIASRMHLLVAAVRHAILTSHQFVKHPWLTTISVSI